MNEVVAEYNDLGLLVKEYQEHAGAKDGSTLYVGYNYDLTAANGEFTKGLRFTSLRYPNGRLVHYTYGSGGSADDYLNRLQAIQDDSSGSPGMALASYTYLGLGTIVIEEYEEPDVRLDYFGGSSGTYAGFDDFDRVVDHRWYDYGNSQDVDRYKYGYDRASNRVWRENTVSKSLGTPVYLDEFYTYDGMHRLKNFDRGQLNGGYTGITGTPSKEEDWTLDPLGNWSNYVQKTAGSTDLNQSRAVNKVNEITGITESTGPSWVTPAYDRNGNMTTIPKPADPTGTFVGTYDAWNRLVKLVEGSDTLAEYQYDGARRRGVKKTYSGGVLDETRHLYYTEPSKWQVIEERLGSSADPDRQFVWGQRYIDDLILRDRDTSDPADGTLDERLYALQDANWNVIGIVNTSGDAEERFFYDAYGHSLALTPAFAIRGNSHFQWETRFAGTRRDDDSALLFIRYRVFNAELATWLQRDLLVRYRNLYSYCLSNPVLYSDPSGLAGDDIRYINYLVRKYGLSHEGRLALHQALKELKGPGGLVPKAVAELEAQSIAALGGKFLRAGGTALSVIGIWLALENTAQAAEPPKDWRDWRYHQSSAEQKRCTCACAKFQAAVTVPSWWAFLDAVEWSGETLASKWVSFGRITAQECHALEDEPRVIEETSVIGFTIYNTSRIRCRFGGLDQGIPECCNQEDSEHLR